MICSPVGQLLIRADERGITGLDFVKQGGIPALPESGEDKHPYLDLAEEWLCAYFAGIKPPVPQDVLHTEGTDFQKRVWTALLQIPYGQTVTYGELAALPSVRGERERMSAQAVGQAVGRNPIAIMIPCHRVVGIDGKMVGFGGGVEIKELLLRHEGVLK